MKQSRKLPSRSSMVYCMYKLSLAKARHGASCVSALCVLEVRLDPQSRTLCPMSAGGVPGTKDTVHYNELTNLATSATRRRLQEQHQLARPATAVLTVKTNSRHLIPPRWETSSEANSIKGGLAHCEISHLARLHQHE